MNLSLLKTLHETLPESGTGHFTLGHVEFIKHVLGQIKPKVIWEFGFNTGHSAAIWLTLSDAEVYAVDPSTEFPTMQGYKQLNIEFPRRINLLNESSRNPSIEATMREIPPDLLLVDGDHSYAGCIEDLRLAARLKIKHIIIDNLEDTDNVGAATNDFLKGNSEYTIHSIVKIGDIITGYIVGVNGK